MQLPHIHPNKLTKQKFKYNASKDDKLIKIYKNKVINEKHDYQDHANEETAAVACQLRQWKHPQGYYHAMYQKKQE